MKRLWKNAAAVCAVAALLAAVWALPLSAVRRADENDNVTVGETYPVDTHHTIIYTGGKPVCTVGVDDLIIIDTPDVLLVCSKERAQDVKKIVEELRAKGKEELL